MINRVSIVFDTDMSNPGMCIVKYPTPDTCVTDYKAEIITDGGYREIANVTGNFMRRRVHRFEPAIARGIKITVYKTGGDKSARITEVRAGYDKE